MSVTFDIPLTKIDVQRRLVIGRAAQEVADKSNEIMDYASARPQFEKWSSEFDRATNGLSKGNLRVMHTKHVAGKIEQIAFDDDSKSIEIVAKVSDENEWQKVLDGAYTGFSIGGGYLKKWTQEGGLTRYTPDIREISLVDSPCIPTARFAELVKADGIIDQLELVGTIRTFSEMWKSAPSSFAAAWASRPQTFGDLHKGYDGTKHPREHDGKFASKTGEHVTGAIAGGVGGVAGGFAGHLYGEKVAGATAHAGAKVYTTARTRLSPAPATGGDAIGRILDNEHLETRALHVGRVAGRRFGVLAGATALGLGGTLAGRAIGAKIDEMMRVRRAKAAGKLDQYQRLNAGVTVRPNSAKQIKAAVRSGRKNAARISAARQIIRGISG